MNKENSTDTTVYGKRGWLISFVFSSAFAVCMNFGRSLDKQGSVAFKSPLMWISILVMAAGGTFLFAFFWKTLLKAEERKGAGKIQTVSGRSFLFTAGIIFLCYLPVFLGVYPGFFVYDAQDELMQVVTRNFSTHHPLIHVLLLGGIIQLIHKISGSYNSGIAVYTLFQMAVLSCVFSYAICRLRKEGMGKKSSLAMALYLGLFPTIVMFSLCSAKDGLFTGMLLLTVMQFRELIKNPEQFFSSRMHIILLLASSVFMMLFRHNGFYAFLVFGAVLLLLRKVTGLLKYRKNLLLLLGGILIIYMIISKGATLALNAQDSEHQEMLTVPIQQLARVYTMEENAFSEEEEAILYEILPKEALNRYTPKVSDGVKLSFCNEAYEENPSRYQKLWIKTGMRHPFAYLNAWFMTSYGFWYPDTVIDVYRGNTVFTFTYQDSSYFGYEVEEPGERHSLIPFLDECYRRMSLEPEIQQIPVISWLFSPGFLFWVTAFISGYFLYAGQYKKLAPWLLPILLWLTVILGPTYLVRYVIFLWILLPVLLWDMAKPGRFEEKEAAG